MSLKEFIRKIQSDPRLIKENYSTLAEYIETGNIEELQTIMIPETEHYFYMIIEEKLKYYNRNQKDPKELIQLILNYKPSTILGNNKFINIISILGILYFPLVFDIIEFINQQEDILFNEILNRFCYEILNNYDISESRRNELKKALNLSTVLFMDRIYNNLAFSDNLAYLDTLNLLIEIIEIPENILSILNNLINNSINNIQNNEDILIKLSEIIYTINDNSKLNIKEFLNISDFIEPYPLFSKLLLEKNFINHKYFFKAINEENLYFSIKYFIKNINIVNNEVVDKFLLLYNPIIYNTNKLNIILKDNEELFRFFIFLSKSDNNINILNTVKLPNRLSIQFLKNIKREDYYLITNKNLFIESYLMIQNKDITILNNIHLLINTNDEGCKKLVLKVIEEFNLSKLDLENLLNFFYTQNSKNINELNIIKNKKNYRLTKDGEIKEGGLEELIIKTLKRLKIPLTLSFERLNIKLYYYYIRDNIEDINDILINEFYNYLFNTTDLFMCFEILIQISKKEINIKVFEYILSIINKLDLEDLISLIDLCKKVNGCDILLINISNRIIYLSSITTEYELLDITVNRFLSINKNNDLLIDLLSINEYNIFKKLLILLNNKSELKELDLHRIVYFLLFKYSDSEFYELQPYIINILLKVMRISYAPFVLFQPFESSDDIFNKIKSLTDKKGKILIKSFLNSIKAYKFSELGAKSKIDQQYLFTNKSKNIADGSTTDVDLGLFL